MSESRYTLVKAGMYKVLREVAEYCSMDTAQDLVRVFGGTRIWVPLRWTAEHELNRIGEAQARRVIDVFGNSVLDVPRRLLTADGLATVIDQLLADDVEHNEIARLVGCSQRTVSRRQHAPRLPGVATRTRRVDPRQIDIDDLLK